MIAYRNIFYVVAIFFFVFSGLMLFPAIVDFCLSDEAAFGFLTVAFFGIFFGGLLFFSCDAQRRVVLNNREKILAVLLFWLVIPVFSALPYYISSFNISFSDALFETVSALSTAGCDTLPNLKSFSVGFALWKILLQLGGGIFFILSCIYVFYELKDRENELSNVQSTDRDIVLRLKSVLSIYLSMAIVGMLFMIHAGATPLDAFGYSVAAITTSGINFGNSADSGDFLQNISWILILLTFIGGCSIGTMQNFGKKGFSILKDRQFMIYFSIVLALGFFLTIYFSLHSTNEEDLSEIIKKAFLAAVSSITTTGIYEQSQETSGNFATSLLYITNFIGGCSGNCTGGVKIFRIITIFFVLKSYFMKIAHSRKVYVPIYNGRKLNETYSVSLLGHFACYTVLAVIFSLLLSSDMEFGRAFGASITAMNSNGPFIDLHRATAAELVALSPWAKIVLIFAMISGRVEFVLFFIILLKTFWRR